MPSTNSAKFLSSSIRAKYKNSGGRHAGRVRCRSRGGGEMRNEIAEHLNFSPQARAFGLNYGEKSTGRNDQGSHPALPLPEVGTILGIRSMTLHDHLVFDRRVVSQ